MIYFSKKLFLRLLTPICQSERPVKVAALFWKIKKLLVKKRSVVLGLFVKSKLLLDKWNFNTIWKNMLQQFTRNIIANEDHNFHTHLYFGLIYKAHLKAALLSTKWNPNSARTLYIKPFKLRINSRFTGLNGCCRQYSL